MNCRLCNHNDLKLYYQVGNKKQFNFYKCKKCGLVNLDINNINIYENQVKYEENFIDPLDKKKNPGSFSTYKYIAKKIKSKGNYIDIGCGNGSLLNYAREDGWDVKGLEISDFLAKKVKEKLNIEVETGNFIEFKDIHPAYNLLTLRHVLEHIPDSIRAMKIINNLLLDEGYAVLEFPNIEGFSFKFKRFLDKFGLYNKKYKPDFKPGHCNEFSRKSFKYLSNISGFELIDWQTYSNKETLNLFYSIFKIATKARVLIKKVKTV